MNRNNARPNIMRPPITGTTFNPMQRNLNRTIIESVPIDPVIIGKLFLLCIEGKVTPIKEYIIQNGLTVNDMVDTNGESILHKILQNQNISNRDKIELFRFFEEKNLLKMSYDSSRITPLHLAVKMQIKEIVEILINNGHNINALDVSNKSPLFYAVVGKTEECPPKKEKELLEKTKFKLEKSDTYQLVQETIKFIQNDQNLLNSFVHIGNTASALDMIYSKNISDILEKDNKKIIDILSSNDSDDVKITKIFDVVNETKLSIANLLIKEKLQACLKPMTFEPNTMGGWGPDANPKNKILKVGNTYEFLNKLNTNVDKKKTKIMTDLASNANKIEDSFNAILEKIINPIDNLLDKFSYEYQILHRLNNLALLHMPVGFNFALAFPLPNLVQIDNLFNNGNIPNNFIVRAIDDNTVMDVDASPAYLHQIPIFPASLYANNPRDKPEINAVKAIHRDIISDVANPLNLNIVANPLIQINGGHFYTKKINIIFTEIQQNIRDIEAERPEITRHLERDLNQANSDSRDIIMRCMKIQKNLLNILNYIPLLYDELILIDNLTVNILMHIRDNLIPKMINSTIDNVAVPANPHNSSNYFGDTLDSQFTFNIFNESNKTKLEQIKNGLYEVCKGYYDELNNIINLINDVNGIKYIGEYFNQFAEVDRFFGNVMTDNINRIFHNELAPINKLPTNYDSFIQLFGNDILQNKRLIVEQFLYQVHSSAYNSYYDGTQPISLPQIGFLQDPADMNNINIATQLAPPRPLNLIFGTASSDPTNLLDSPANLAGTIGIKSSLRTQKKNSAIPIIGQNLSEHFNILKYYIIKYILNDSYRLLMQKINNVPLNAADVQKQSFVDLIFNIYEKIRTKLQLDSNDRSIILIIIAKCIDNLLNSNIENAILSGINRFAYRTNRNQFTRDILDLLARLKTKNLASLGSDNFDIANYLKDNKFLIQDMRDYVKTIIKDSQNEYLFTYAEDVFEKNTIDGKSNIFKLYSQNILDNATVSCYSLDYDIIKLLLDNRADVSIKDKEGSTVIFGAIDMNNVDLVKYFVDKLPVYNKHSENIFGIKPINHITKHLKYFTSMFLDKNILKDLVSISTNLVSKKTQVTNKMRYHSEIYQMIIIMINHYFYFTGKQYINGWTQSNQRTLNLLLNMGSSELPLLTTLDRIQSTYKDDYLKGFIKDDKEYSEKNMARKKEILAQYRSLSEEFLQVTTSDLRKKIIFETSKKLLDSLGRTEFRDISNNIAQMMNIEKIIDGDPFSKNTIDTIKGKIEETNIAANMNTTDIIALYESIQSKIINNTKFGINNDYKTYINLWKKSIENNDIYGVNIIENISQFILTHLEIKDSPQILLIQSYLDKVISKLATDYMELEYVYKGDNYVLDTLINIIKHVLSNTVGVNLLNIIQQLLREELRINFPKGVETDLDYAKIIDTKIKKIIESSNVQGFQLDSYIMDTLIEKVIKINLNLYEDTYDKDNMEDINNVFLKINKILESNVVIKLNDSSQVIKELKEKIYPYFKDYLEVNLKVIKKFIDGYMSSLINYTNCLTNYSLILVKANTEKEIKK